MWNGGPKAKFLGLATLICASILSGWALFSVLQSHALEAELLTLPPDDLPAHADIVNFAIAHARPVYASNCAACHGGDMRGRPDKPAPDLTGSSSIYDSSSVVSLEHTIRYGIRSGQSMGRNIADMPAFGLSGQLSSAEIHDVASYVQSLSQPVIDAKSVIRGHEIFENKGVCYDCHNGDGTGNRDYGAPAFNGHWLYGGDLDSIYHSIYYGRHGLCPAWADKLSSLDIIALALTVFEKSHGSNDTVSGSASLLKARAASAAFVTNASVPLHGNN